MTMISVQNAAATAAYVHMLIDRRECGVRQTSALLIRSC